MMKHLWIAAVSLISCQLTAETVGNVEFQFPPSNYEWKLFVDETFFIDDEDTFLADDEEAEEETDHLKVFTHREGDALETLAVMFISEEDLDEEEEELDTLELAQKNLNETFNRFFPNHQIIINALTDNGEDSFMDWELNDGTQDLMHGFLRAHTTKNESGKTQTVTLLNYSTTAPKSEYNQWLWKEFLSQAVFSE